MSDLLSVKVTQASLNQTALKWPENMANHYAAIDIAVAEGSDVVLMPELSLTAYEVGDNFKGTDNNRIYAALSSIAAYANAKDPNLLVSVGNPWRVNFREAFDNAAPHPSNIKNAFYGRHHLPFNAQTLIGGGRILGMTAKANLFKDERGYEERHFEEWDPLDAERIASLLGVECSNGNLPIKLPNGEIIPFGRPIIYVTDKKGNNYVHATGICEEKWAATKFDTLSDDYRYDRDNIIPSISRYLGTTAGLFLEIANASPPSKLKQDKHIHLNDLASQYADVVVDTDGLGTSGSLFAQFGHRLISQNGATISAGARMVFGPLATTTSVVQFSKASEDLEALSHQKFERTFKDPSAKPHAVLAWNVKGGGAEWDNPDNPDRWIEERIRNQALWVYDYMRKAGSVRIANALSGGQDSGWNCVEYYVMIAVAMNQRGVEAVCDDMNVPFKEDVMKACNESGEDIHVALKAFMDNYIITHYFPTRNSSKLSEAGARLLIEGDEEQGIEGIGGKFVVRDVDDLVTMCAITFGMENTRDMAPERKAALSVEMSDFVHANPNKYTPEEMQKWEERLRAEYPEMEEFTSVAIPGQSIAYENFQARIRSVLEWAVANVNKAMPHANPNLTEAYTNNTTAQGDLQGGAVNANGGIFKDEEQAFLTYLEEKGIPGILPPIKALSLINNNEPTAELLPMDENGEVEQNDVDTMQATMPQLTIMARLMHHEITQDIGGGRELNASEVYDRAREFPEFPGQDDNKMFNTVANFYRRWNSGQFKIHMGTIQPTFGDNVDHQTSRRTPNLSGNNLDEVCTLGINIMFKWAEEEGLSWSEEKRHELVQRTWNGDPQFVKDFVGKLWNRDKSLENMTYNLRGLYGNIKQNGWNGEFTPLPKSHPITLALAA